MKDRDKKQKKGARKRILTALVAVCALGLALIAANALGIFPPEPVRRYLDGIAWRAGLSGRAERELEFSSGFDAAFAPVRGSVVSAGRMGVTLYSGSNEELVRETVPMREPAVAYGGTRAVVYDVGGTQLRCLDEHGIIARLETTGGILSASVGRGGYLTVCETASGVYRAIVRVYKISGGSATNMYEWYSGEDYVLSAAVSDDNRRLAVLTLGVNGGRIVMFSLDSTTPLAELAQPGSAIIEMSFMRDGTLLYRTRSEIYAVSKDGQARRVLEIPSGTLCGWSADGGVFAALYVESGGVGTLITLTSDGETARVELPTSEQGGLGHAWLCVSGDRLVLLRGDGARVFDSECDFIALYADAERYKEAYPLGGSAVLCVGARQGHVYA